MVQTHCIDKKVLIICGPTASGKTALAVECAKLLNSEVISADSMYIYKGLDIGTAKPNVEERQGVLHHMIDVVSPFDSFSVSDYKLQAEECLNRLFDKGKIPIICGGTGFYINSLLYDFSYGNSAANLEARNKYKELAEKYGNEYVYNVLAEVDPISAQKLHFNDVKRVIRALEIYESGYKKSDILDDKKPKFNYVAYSIDHERDVLYQRIDSRVDQMIDGGLVDEVNRLLSSCVDKSCQCMQGIGYKEILEYLEGNINLNEASDLIKLNTRHYAKRQITFFKRLEGLVSLQPDQVNVLAKRIVDEL